MSEIVVVNNGAVISIQEFQKKQEEQKREETKVFKFVVEGFKPKCQQI